jgi:hypothetical protein
MQDKPTPADEIGDAERSVLYALTTPTEGQPVWSVADLGREIESADDADVAVNGLLRAGLIYQTTDGFVFASRAAVCAMQITGHVV